jgi:OmpA-OmpF porin, OOP family
MKGVLIIAIAFLVGFTKVTFGQTEGTITTESPEVGSSNTRDVRIERVRLTSRYTIVYMSFKLRASGNSGQQAPQTLEDLMEIFRNGGGNGKYNSRNFISISPQSKLTDSQSGKKFKYIKASGIPEEPEQLDVYPGEKVNFKIYYQRLDPGITEFDFYEGENNQRVKYWNFNNIKIKNPGLKNIPKPESPEPDEKQESSQPTNTLLKGTITDANSQKPLLAKVDVKWAETMLTVDSTMSFASSGTYKVQLDKKGKYTVLVSAPGYLVAQHDVETNANTITADIALKPLVAGDLVLLENVYFNTAQYELLSTSFAELDKVVMLLQYNPTLRIVLEGHTDTVGNAASNQQLSEQRVLAVKNYLIGKGINNNRIETKGWGSSKPVNTNGTEAERSKNRRVEFRILSI